MNFVIQSTFDKTSTITWRIAGTAAAFTILFHDSEIGLNLGIFSLLLLGYWIMSFPQSSRKLSVILPASATFATPLAVAWYGTPETILWSFICLFILSRQVYFPEQSLLLSETKSFINIFVAPVHGIRSLLSSEQGGSTPLTSKAVRILLFVVLPVGFTWLFAGIYSQLNP